MLEELTRTVEEKGSLIRRLRDEIGKVIVGQEYMIERMLIGLLADGHLLVEGVPGLAKTTAVKTLAQAVRTSFQRIQFTPDLLPADLIGTQIYLPKTGEFQIKKGPIFHNIILGDEINRAPAKVQSALLEAMQERQVTIGEETFPLERPFLVMATQNPIEQEGTYPLPEAQVDRFMLKLSVTYPTRDEEKAIMKRMASSPPPDVTAVITPQEIIAAREIVRQIYIDEKLQDYIVSIVFATRDPGAYKLPSISQMIQYGASPRATIYLNQASKAYAFLHGRAYVTPQDIKSIGKDILRHRIILTYEAEAENLNADDIIDRIFETVEVP
ncbi:MAG: AAA family ATPase [bacterium]